MRAVSRAEFARSWETGLVVAAAKGDVMFGNRIARTDQWKDRLPADDHDFRMWSLVTPSASECPWVFESPDAEYVVRPI